jgi:UDP-glucose 4-epimerase
MRYFITGGAGFIGSHLVDKLAKTGPVTVYDNLSSGSKEFIKHHLSGADFQFIQADLLELDTLKRAMENHDVVFHLAANPEARIGITDTDYDLKQGTIVTYNVLEAMRVNKINKLVFASSSTVYGETPVEPIPENYGPLRPISLYGASKLAGEGLVTAFCHLFDMQAWIFRFANVVGPHATHGAIFDFINKLRQNPAELEILGDGTQEKPYIHVQDCVDGILYGFQHSNGQVNVFNLGCPSATRVSAIARMLVAEMGLSNARFRYTGGERGWPGDVPQVRFDTSKMDGLGWKPRYSSDEAVRRAIKDILGKPG